MPYFFYLIISLGAFVTVFRITLAFTLKWIAPQQLRAKQDFRFEPTLSILLPCYNEGKTVYETIESIVHSDYPRDRFEIIAVDDCSVDDSFQWMLKAQVDFPEVRMRISRQEENSGKVQCVARALTQSESEIIISIDSDCIFDRQVIRELVSCFVDTRMGAVGGQVGIRNPNDNWYTMGQVLWYYLAFNLVKVPEIWTRSTTCISGCLFAIRRELMLKIMPVAVHRTFLGTRVIEGEDRFMTHMVLLHGYQNYINVNAKCWTTAPSTFKQLFTQQLRWRRSALRDIFFTIGNLPDHLRRLPLNYTYTVIASFCVMMATTFAFVSLPFSAISSWATPDRWIGAASVAAICTLVLKIYAPEQHITNPMKMFAFLLWAIVDAFFITTLAMCTLDVGDWGTRNKSQQETQNALI